MNWPKLSKQTPSLLLMHWVSDPRGPGYFQRSPGWLLSCFAGNLPVTIPVSSVNVLKDKGQISQEGENPAGWDGRWERRV